MSGARLLGSLKAPSWSSFHGFKVQFPVPSRSGDSAALPDELFVDAADGEDDDMED